MSKMKYYNTAEYLYIYENTPIDEICTQLNLSRRTLFYWKRKYNWDFKQARFFNTEKSFNIELISFTRNLIQNLSKSLDTKTPINSSQLYSLMNLVEFLNI